MILQLAQLTLAHEVQHGGLTLIAVNLGLEVAHLHVLHAHIIACLLESSVLIAGTIRSVVRGERLILGLVSLPERLLELDGLSSLQSVERHLLVQALGQRGYLLLQLVTLGAARQLILQLSDLLASLVDLQILLLEVHLKSMNLSLLLEHKLSQLVDLIRA